MNDLVTGIETDAGISIDPGANIVRPQYEGVVQCCVAGWLEFLAETTKYT
jgi:hypothetical protein